MAAYEPVHRILEASADRSADAIAVVQGGVRTCYGEIESAANRMAHLLTERGVQSGDRVGLLAENGLDYIVGFFGILKAGGCVVALNSALKAHTLQKLLADSCAAALVTRLAQVRSDLPDIVVDCPGLRSIVIDRANPRWSLPTGIQLLNATDLQQQSDSRSSANIVPGERAAILYTSGSTGTPRGATLTHANLAANTSQILEYLPIGAKDRVMVVLPFHYSFGNSLLLTHLKAGARLVIDNRFAYPQVILEGMLREKATSFAGVPSTYAILCAKTEFLRTDWTDLQYLTQAGGAMAMTLTRRIRQALPDRIQFFVMYGQTEASARLSFLPPDRLHEKLGSIGIPIPGVTLTVRRADGSECATDEVGEVVAQGDNIMEGYWNDQEETAKVLHTDGLHTGDLGRKDEDGYIFLVDRIKNMIKTGAHRVSAKEIEETIHELPAIVEVCVVGMPDELLGEAIEAFVVQADGADLDERSVMHHCHEKLAMFKIPRKVTFLKALPKSTSGKILKAELGKKSQM